MNEILDKKIAAIELAIEGNLASMPDTYYSGRLSGLRAGLMALKDVKKEIESKGSLELPDELWDTYSQYIDDDIESLSYYAGRTVMTKEKFEEMISYLSPEKKAQLPNLYDLKVRKIEDGSIHTVNKYIKDPDGEIHIWCNSWYAHHVIGRDCEFALSDDDLKTVKEYTENDRAAWNDLRDDFFTELTDSFDTLKKVNATPHDVFEWFRKKLQKI